MRPDVRRALGEWEIDPVSIVQTPTGTMNETFFVTTRTNGRFVIRRHRTRDTERLRWEHYVLEQVRCRGVPAPRLVPSRSGAATVDVGDELWSLFEHVDGEHVRRDDLTPNHAWAMGRALAEIHSALATAPILRRAPAFGAASHLRERAAALLTSIASADGEAEQAARRWLSEFDVWHGRVGDAPPPERGRVQIVHGDFQDTNVLFDDSRVAAVIDWDKAEAREAVEEVHRAMHLSFRLEPALCAAFVDGYRAARTLTPEELDRGATLYGYERDRSLWLLEELFIRGNERVRGLVASTVFVPFEDLWRGLRARL